MEDSAFEVELVDDYIRAARVEGDEILLTHRLRVMANATANQELRVLIAQRLLELGDEEVGRRILHAPIPLARFVFRLRRVAGPEHGRGQHTESGACANCVRNSSHESR